MNSCTKSKTQIVKVSFSKNILPILQSNCAINSSCHVGANNTNGHIDLTDSMAYKTIINKNLVIINNPAASLIYSSISNGIMPKAPYAKLSNSQISLFLNWIEQGAVNN